MTKPPPSLSELQDWMGKILTRREAPDDQWMDFIVEDDVPRLERLNIYAAAYQIRLEDCLRKDFPALDRLIPHCELDEMLFEYFQRHPSTSFNIGDAGAQLPQFIVESHWSRKYPWASELARLEWLINEAFYAPEVPPLDLEKITTLSPEAWNECSFKVDPSLRLMRARFDVDALWRDELSVENLSEGEYFLSVFRENDQVWVQPMEPTDYHLLDLVSKGLTFSEICDGSLHLFPSVEETLAAFQTAFPTWVSEGLLRDVRT